MIAKICRNDAKEYLCESMSPMSPLSLVSQELHGVGESRVLPFHTKHDWLHQEHQGDPSAQIESEDNETRTLGAERNAEQSSSSNAENQGRHNHVIVDSVDWDAHHVPNVISRNGDPAWKILHTELGETEAWSRGSEPVKHHAIVYTTLLQETNMTNQCKIIQM